LPNRLEPETAHSGDRIWREQLGGLAHAHRVVGGEGGENVAFVATHVLAEETPPANR
jgi:hypothetical protein